MAKKFQYTKKQHETGVTITTPSAYGSHSSMVVEENGDEVTCEDERGKYTTLRSRLDSGLADPNRWSGR